jgi:nicotinate phosphoribosyltransferase
MPHALILVVGDTVRATEVFRKIIGGKVKCVSLIDTIYDEKFEALRVAKALGKKLSAVRIDTPSSRRGNMREILEEVRWELDLNGFKYVKIFVSGGIDEKKILELNPCADGYGIGTSIADAPVIDFSLDIVEIEGEPFAKRGKKAGGKKLMRCRRCLKRVNLPLRSKATRCFCGGKLTGMHRVVMRSGKILRALPSPRQIRANTLKQLEKVDLSA